MAIGKVSSVQDMGNIERMREQQKKKAEEKHINPEPNKDQSVPGQDAKVKQYEKSIQKVEQDIQKTDKDATLSKEERQDKRMELKQQLEDLNRRLEEAKREVEQQEIQATRSEVAGQSSAGLQSAQGQDMAQERQDAIRDDIKNDIDDKRPTSTLTYEQQQVMLLGKDAVEQAKGMGNTAKDMENRMRVLSREIKIDKERGLSAEEKQKEQDKLSDKVNEVREKASTKLGETKRKVEEIQDEKETKREQVRFIQSQEQAKTEMPVFQIQI